MTTGALCSLMTNNTGGSELHRFASINDLSLEMAGAQCLDADYDNKGEEIFDKINVNAKENY